MGAGTRVEKMASDTSVQNYSLAWQERQRNELRGRLAGRLGALGKNSGVRCPVLLQGFFPTQESNPPLLHLSICIGREVL